MSVQVRGGLFSVRSYRAINETGQQLKTTGAEILLRFTPEPDLDADVVSLVQVVKDTVVQTGVSEQLRQKSGAFEQRTVAENGPDDGTAVDQELYDQNGKLVNLDPRYTEQRLAASEPLRQKPAGLFQPPTAWPTIKRWFHRQDTNTTSGLYVFDGKTISFSTTSWEGTVNYAGDYFKQNDEIILSTHSHVNGYSAKNREYTRLPE